MDCKSLGRRIKEERINKGISQEQLAENINVSRQYITMIENGERKVRIDVLLQISYALNTSIDYLLKGLNLTHKDVVQEFGELISSCTNTEATIILDIVKSAIPLTKRQK